MVEVKHIYDLQAIALEKARQAFNQAKIEGKSPLECLIIRLEAFDQEYKKLQNLSQGVMILC